MEDEVTFIEASIVSELCIIRYIITVCKWMQSLHFQRMKEYPGAILQAKGIKLI